MGSVNSSGIYVYDAADQVSPIHTFANLQSSALTARFGQVFTSCTSSSRPSLPYDNQLINETDTGTIRYYNAPTGKWVSIPYRSGSARITSPEVTGTQSVGVTLARYAFPSLTYSALVTVSSSVGGTQPAGAQTRLRTGWDAGSFTDSTAPANSLMEDLFTNNGSTQIVLGLKADGIVTVTAGTTPTFRSFLVLTSGTYAISDLVGFNMWLTWTESSSAV